MLLTTSLLLAIAAAAVYDSRSAWSQLIYRGMLLTVAAAVTATLATTVATAATRSVVSTTRGVASTATSACALRSLVDTNGAAVEPGQHSQPEYKVAKGGGEEES